MRCLTLNQRIIIRTPMTTIEVADEHQLDKAIQAATALLNAEASIQRPPSPPSTEEK